ncbi:aspartyl/asparaginyl beta-hydroxylase domain-containing protein [Colwellia piezophila]|uniref:aspartyl/asparaginyl beta-hydroxylase domain-containing protein n=1 Tax=Colwellia piezophila TaxID=211668 RepID=UPI00036B8D66|nr:aspartyl/asparaginyl beta-hydroxylase domain-containing protein [Colwellia piezophila]
MKLAHEFFKLPLSFDVAKLQEEVALFSANDWHQHHEGFKGNSAIPLISVNGEINNDFTGEMLATSALKQSKYLQQVIASFDEVFGRSRLMKLDASFEVPLHSDVNYHWYKRVRIHIPIITDADVIFHCGDKAVHMAEGECWIFDTWKQHRVVNNSSKDRVHLVIDTFGSSQFWQMINKAFVPWHSQAEEPIKSLAYTPASKSQTLMEKYNNPIVMSPGELDFMLNELTDEVQQVSSNDSANTHRLIDILHGFSQNWRRLWSLYGNEKVGWPHYHQCRDGTFHQAKVVASQLKISNDSSALDMLAHCIIVPALTPPTGR